MCRLSVGLAKGPSWLQERLDTRSLFSDITSHTSIKQSYSPVIPPPRFTSSSPPDHRFEVGIGMVGWGCMGFVLVRAGCRMVG